MQVPPRPLIDSLTTYMFMQPLRVHVLAIAVPVVFSSCSTVLLVLIAYACTVEPLYCGHLGDLVKCPV